MKPLTKPTYPVLQVILARNQVKNALERIARTTSYNNSPNELEAIASNALDNLETLMVAFRAALSERPEITGTIPTGRAGPIVAFSNEERN